MTAAFELHWVQRPGRKVAALHRPSTLDQALRVLADDPDARPLAGGTDLLLDLARSAGTPVALVDLTAIERFTLIGDDAHSDSDGFVLAGGVTHSDVVAHAGIVAHALPLAQACVEVGSPQLRNRATIAGNLATASPANDTITALMALGATLELQRADGAARASRTVAVDEFFTGFRETVLRPGELIAAIRVPRLSATQRGIWVKLGLRKAQAISVVHAGLVIDTAGDGVVIGARIALGSVAPTVELSEAAAGALTGAPLTPETIRAAATAAADSVTPIDDVRATAAYRSDAVVTIVTRGLGALMHDRQRDRWPARPPRLSTRPLPLPAARRSAHPAPRPFIDDHTEITVTVNGTDVTTSDAASCTLLDWVRTHAGTGTKEGCAEGECGACTVMLDGDAVMSCLVGAAQADGASVKTIEGLGAGERIHPVQQAFVDRFAVQCGFCIPGFVMAAAALVDEVPSPSRSEIELGLAGNLCRCTGYYSIIDAVTAAAAARPAQGSEEPT